MSFEKKMKVLEGLWYNKENSMICPQCGGSLTIIQVEPIYDTENAYTPYKTIIECSSCSFKITTESFTILGGVKNFDTHNLTISSWSPSGSRDVSEYEHHIDFELLQKLKKSGELVEFLIVNNKAVQVIG